MNIIINWMQNELFNCISYPSMFGITSYCQCASLLAFCFKLHGSSRYLHFSIQETQYWRFQQIIHFHEKITKLYVFGTSLYFPVTCMLQS